MFINLVLLLIGSRLIVDSLVEFYNTLPNVSLVLPLAYFCVNVCVYNYTAIRAPACIRTHMHICRFINFKEIIQMARLRVEVIMTCICLLCQ